MDDRSKIIILNGPPGCGKDTLAELLQRIFGTGTAKITTFKEPMFQIAMAMTGMSREEWFAMYNNRDLKERRQRELCDKTVRDFMIWISEGIVKPMFGEEQFGKLASKQVQPHGVTIFSDGGFPAEVRELHNNCYKSHMIYIVRLHRGGFSFDGDSRQYLYGERFHTLDYIDYNLHDGCAADDAFAIHRLVSR